MKRPGQLPGLILPRKLYQESLMSRNYMVKIKKTKGNYRQNAERN